MTAFTDQVRQGLYSRMYHWFLSTGIAKGNKTKAHFMARNYVLKQHPLS